MKEHYQLLHLPLSAYSTLLPFVKLPKFADNNPTAGHSGRDKSAHKWETDHVVSLCRQNNLKKTLGTNAWMTVKTIVDLANSQWDEQAPSLDWVSSSFYKSMAATQLPESLTSIINNACNFTRHSVAGFSVPEVVLRLGQLWSLVNHLQRTAWARKAQEVWHKDSIENLLIFKIKWADSWSFITLKQLKKISKI